MRNYSFRSYSLGALCAIAVLLPTARAAERIEEIVVTAGFRDSALMQSAGSISVLDERRLHERNVHQVTDILNALPNVNYSSGGARARFIQIRGMGDLEQFVDPKHYPSVGVLIDGLEIGNTASGALLSDVKQIDVLRGPQGTRFGATALAGLINIRTQEPGDTINGTLKAGYGNRASWVAAAALGGPLTDTLGGRLAVQQLSSDGFMRNDFLGADDTQNIDERSVHGKLLWRGPNALTLRLGAIYLDADNGYDAFSLDNSRRTLSDQPGRDEQRTQAVAVQAGWPLRSNVTLQAQLSWSGNDEAYSYDEDWVFAGFCDGRRCAPKDEFSGADALQRGRDVYALDMRIHAGSAALSWVAGGYLQARDESLLRQHSGAFASDYDTRRYALYGQLDYALTPAWQITAGLRLEHFRDDYSDSKDLNSNSSDSYWSGELTLKYRHTDNALLYATLARGVKPGGINTEASSNYAPIAAHFKPFLAARLPFAAETVFNKELGIKGHYLARRLALKLALFHTDRRHAQLESWVWDASNVIWTGLLDSTSDAHNYGAELEINYQLGKAVSMFINLGYLRAKVDALTTYDLDKDQFITRSGRGQAKAPRWQYNFGIEAALSENLQGRIEVEGKDSSLFGYYHDGRLDGFTLAHASISYRLGDVHIQGWINNIFNERYAVHGLYFANDPQDGFSVNRAYFQWGEPRSYGLGVRYDFSL